MSTKIHAANNPGVSGPHPGVEEWIAYHGRTLGAADEDRLRSHLVTCPECVALLLDVEAFQRPGEDDHAQVTEFERVAAWRSLQGSLERQSSRRVLGSHRLALAASVLIGVLGFSAWMSGQRANGSLREQIDALSAPQPNPVIVDLSEAPATRSGGESATELSLDTTNTLVLHLTEPQDFADYEVEILDGRQETVWANGGLLLDEDFLTVTLALPVGSLPGGEYRIRLYGVGAEERVLLADYPPILLRST